MEDEHVANFNAITGASPEVARSFLEMTAGNFERAVELFFENPDLASGVGAGLNANASSSNTPNPPPVATSLRPSLGRQDSDGIIHIDSDDDEDMDFDNDSDNDDGERAAAAQAAALAQEEEDMAMAKALQEEEYQDRSRPQGDDVRAPIARTTETLVAPGGGWSGEENMEHAMLEDLRRRQRRYPRK